MAKKKLSFAQVKQIAEDHLKVAYGKELREVAITWAKQEVDEDHRDIWKINIEYVEIIELKTFKRSALFTIDAMGGEVIEFHKDYAWKF